MSQEKTLRRTAPGQKPENEREKNTPGSDNGATYENVLTSEIKRIAQLFISALDLCKKKLSGEIDMRKQNRIESEEQSFAPPEQILALYEKKQETFESRKRFHPTENAVDSDQMPPDVFFPSEYKMIPDQLVQRGGFTNPNPSDFQAATDQVFYKLLEAAEHSNETLQSLRETSKDIYKELTE